MKKLFTMMALGLVAGAAMAVPTATVTFTTTADLLYANPTTLATSGWYVEIILAESAGAYNESLIYQTIPSVARAGYINNDPVADSSGQFALDFSFTQTDSTYLGKYASVRFYDNYDKAVATKYGVLSSWYEVTASPVGADGDPRPTTADQVIFLGKSGDKVTLDYDVPAVPEPTSMALVGLGSLAMLIRRKMRKDA